MAKGLISQLFSGSARPQSLEAAAIQVFPRNVVAKAYAAGPNGFVESIAHIMGISQMQVVESLADQFALPVCATIKMPTEELILKTGYTAETLIERDIVPQAAPTLESGYSLVVANPDLISLDNFQRRGIPVLMGVRSEITSTWRAYCECSPEKKSDVPRVQSEPQEQPKDINLVALGALFSLAKEVKRLGGESLLLGYPSDERYQIRTASGRYSGRLHPDLVDWIAKQSRKENYRKLSLEKPANIQHEISRVFLSGFINKSRLVYLLLWESTLLPNQRSQLQLEHSKQEEKTRILGDSNKKQIKNTASTKGRIPTSKILLVDDDKRLSEILARILTAKGFHVTLAGNGSEALVLLDDHSYRPDLMICDIHMPIIDGAHLMAHLKEIGIHLPTLVITSDDTPPTKAQMILMGADAYVHKHEDPSILVAWCSSLSKKKTRTDHMVGGVGSFASTNTAPPLRLASKV